MEQYKKEFIEFMIDCQVLKFGDFVTKSGRKTPFFVNTGYYRTGSQLKKLGEYYAKAILVGDQENILSGEIVFRPDSQVSKEGLAFSKVIIKETADVEEYFKNLIIFLVCGFQGTYLTNFAFASSVIRTLNLLQAFKTLITGKTSLS